MNYDFVEDRGWIGVKQSVSKLVQRKIGSVDCLMIFWKMFDETVIEVMGDGSGF